MATCWPIVLGWGMEIFAEKLQLIIYENIIQQINSGKNIINIHKQDNTKALDVGRIYILIKSFG